MSDNEKKIDPKLLEAMEEIEQEESQVEDDVEEESIEQEDSHEDQIETLTPEVEKARKNGYLSREEYIAKKGTDEGYKSPEEFNRFGEIYPEIRESLKGLSKKLEQRDKELEASLKYIENVREREKRAARLELERQLREADSIGDTEAVRRLTREEAKLDYQDAQEAAQQVGNDIQSAVQKFQDRNPWYTVDQEMTARAMQIDQEIRQGKYEHIFPKPTNYEQLGNQIEIVMKQEFGDRMSMKSRQSSPTISTAKSAVQKTVVETTNHSFRNLSDEHKMIFRATKRMLEKSGIDYTEQEFIKKLQKDGEI